MRRVEHVGCMWEGRIANRVLVENKTTFRVGG
jgi:hypothetical protein